MKKLILVLTVLMPLLSCSDSPMDLSEYQGKNYIENSNLASGDWLIKGNAVDYGYNYMTLTDESGTYATGPDGTAYRLEIPNLFPNGDFETGASPGWTATASASNANNPVSGFSLYFNLTSVQTAAYTLSNLLDIAAGVDPATENPQYSIKFDLNTSPSYTDIQFLYYNGGTKIEPIWQVTGLSSWLVQNYEFPYLSSALDGGMTITVSAGSTFNIGDNKQQEGNIDNIRLTRTDFDNTVYLTVPQKQSGRVDLVSGIYRFSLYVREEDNTQVSPTAGFLNAFKSSGVTLFINDSPEEFTAAEYSTTWTKLSMEKFIQINNGDSITLKISPTLTTSGDISKDAGRVVISSPSLYFISD